MGSVRKPEVPGKAEPPWASSAPSPKSADGNTPTVDLEEEVDLATESRSHTRRRPGREDRFSFAPRPAELFSQVRFASPSSVKPSARNVPAPVATSA